MVATPLLRPCAVWPYQSRSCNRRATVEAVPQSSKPANDDVLPAIQAAFRARRRDPRLGARLHRRLGRRHRDPGDPRRSRRQPRRCAVDFQRLCADPVGADPRRRGRRRQVRASPHLRRRHRVVRRRIARLRACAGYALADSGPRPCRASAPPSWCRAALPSSPRPTRKRNVAGRSASGPHHRR